VIGTTRSIFGEESFGEYGWRIPFLLSFALLAVSLYIRVQMQESPLFTRLEREGKTSKNPFKESFGNPVNLRDVLLALFGATAGQGVGWYTGQFYALTFLQATLKIDWRTSYWVMAIALLVTTPAHLRAAVHGHEAPRQPHGSAEGGPGSDQRAHAGAAAGHPDGVRVHGVWPHRGLPGRAVSDPHSLQLDVLALSPRQSDRAHIG
jgi:hypothetical protein